MRNFETVISAWDGDKLVGMTCTMDDGIMTAYVHYLLVRPNYQDHGIGKHLVDKIKDIYKDYLRIVAVGYDDEVGFYLLMQEYHDFYKSWMNCTNVGITFQMLFDEI